MSLNDFIVNLLVNNSTIRVKASEIKLFYLDILRE